MNKLTGKIIVITGATKGVGKALADFYSQDNTVIAIARNIPPNTTGAYSCDIADEKRVAEVFCDIGAKYGKIDLLINNAGVGLSGATELLPTEEIKKTFDVNYFGALYCVQNAIKYMGAGAKLVNVASVSAYAPMPYRAIYNSSKAALKSLTDSLIMELEPLNICCTTLLLGDVATDFASHRTLYETTDARYQKDVAAVDAYVAARGKAKKMPILQAVKIINKILIRKKFARSYVIGRKYKAAYLLSVLFPTLSLKITSKLFKKA